MSEGTLDVPPDYGAKKSIYKTVIHFTVSYDQQANPAEHFFLFLKK